MLFKGKFGLPFLVSVCNFPCDERCPHQPAALKSGKWGDLTASLAQLFVLRVFL